MLYSRSIKLKETKNQQQKDETVLENLKRKKKPINYLKSTEEMRI